MMDSLMRSTKAITVTLGARLLKKAEQVAKEENRTRSELLREALGHYLEEREWRRIYRYGEGKAKRLGIQEKDVERLVDDLR
jgi:CopG family transcriptional regulator/antitoxin EndoAI